MAQPEGMSFPEFLSWIWDPDSDDDESSPMGFNDPSAWEPGDDEEEEE